MRLLLDAHLALPIAERLTAEGIETESLRDWHGGRYLRAEDPELLSLAAEERRVLVTYDNRIQPLLKEWAAMGR